MQFQTALIENYILSLNQPADVTDISNLISQSKPRYRQKLQFVNNDWLGLRN